MRLCTRNRSRCPSRTQLLRLCSWTSLFISTVSLLGFRRIPAPIHTRPSFPRLPHPTVSFVPSIASLRTKQQQRRRGARQASVDASSEQQIDGTVPFLVQRERFRSLRSRRHARCLGRVWWLSQPSKGNPLPSPEVNPEVNF